MSRPVIVDASALVAIVFQEPDARDISRAIAADRTRLISTFTVLEAGTAIEARKGEPAGRDLDLLLHRTAIEQVPFSPEHAAVARDAWRRYGRGRHPASLTIGDCIAYALARVTGEPLLYKGKDFAMPTSRRSRTESPYWIANRIVCCTS